MKETNTPGWVGDQYVIETRIRRAAKAHVCECCCEPIDAGTLYVAHTTVEDGWTTWKFHGECYVESGGGDGCFGCKIWRRPEWRWPREEGAQDD